MQQHLIFEVPTPNTYMIVTYLGKNISEYRKNVLKILCCNNPCCPVCSHTMKYHSNYIRHVHIGETVEWIDIYRFECTNCNKTHAILTDFISPKKHYSDCDIELTLMDIEEKVLAEKIEITAKRWTVESKKKVIQAAGVLKLLLYRLFNKNIGEVFLFKLQPFELICRILEKYPTVEDSNLIIGEVNIWLLESEVGLYI